MHTNGRISSGTSIANHPASLWTLCGAPAAGRTVSNQRQWWTISWLRSASGWTTMLSHVVKQLDLAGFAVATSYIIGRSCSWVADLSGGYLIYRPPRRPYVQCMHRVNGNTCWSSVQKDVRHCSFEITKIKFSQRAGVGR